VDALGCIINDTTVITEPAALNANCSSTNSVCGQCTGSATISASGGVPPYTYSWPGGTLHNLCPGTYTGTVTDSAGCTDSCSVTIYSVGSNLTAFCSGTNSSSCDSCNGTATITASGGTPPYTYSWPGGTLHNLCPGTYTGTITDSIGCTDSCSVTISAMMAKGVIRPCDTIIIDTSIDVSIARSMESNELQQPVAVNRAYPNPFTEMVNIEFNSAEGGNAYIVLQNVVGSIVKKYRVASVKGNNIIRMDGRDLAQGIYFVKITTSGSVVIKILRR
jgi:hypothetical protein